MGGLTKIVVKEEAAVHYIISRFASDLQDPAGVLISQRPFHGTSRTKPPEFFVTFQAEIGFRKNLRETEGLNLLCVAWR